MKNFPKSAIDVHMFLTRRAALSLECKGLHHSRGSVYALCKREYDLKGNKAHVLDQMNAIRDQLLEEHTR